MQQAISFWMEAYKKGWFVRWSIINNATNDVVGTIEEFRREAGDFFTDCGLLRLDLRSDYEKTEEIENILTLIVEPSFSMFGCGIIATKAIPRAVERIAALKRIGFSFSDNKLVGNDGMRYGDYWIFGDKYNEMIGE